MNRAHDGGTKGLLLSSQDQPFLNNWLSFPVFDEEEIEAALLPFVSNTNDGQPGSKGSFSLNAGNPNLNIDGFSAVPASSSNNNSNPSQGFQFPSSSIPFIPPSNSSLLGGGQNLASFLGLSSALKTNNSIASSVMDSSKLIPPGSPNDIDQSPNASDNDFGERMMDGTLSTQPRPRGRRRLHPDDGNNDKRMRNKAAAEKYRLKKRKEYETMEVRLIELEQKLQQQERLIEELTREREFNKLIMARCPTCTYTQTATFLSNKGNNPMSN